MQYKTKEELAKYAINYYLEKNEVLEIEVEEVAQNLHQKAACFVTVYIKRNLRGCIGNYQAFEPLYKNIIRNAIGSVSSDYRFAPISRSEISQLTVEVSVLSPPEEYRPKNSEELLKYLEKEKPGLVIEKNGRKALFLPQVWEELRRPEEFLSHLCFKAGLSPTAWQASDMLFWVFQKKEI